MTTKGRPPATPDSPSAEGDGSDGTCEPGPPAKAGKASTVAQAKGSRRAGKTSAKSRKKQTATAGGEGRPTGTKSPPRHLNIRPGWDCAVCGVPWPCGPAREKLLEECGRLPSVLTVYLSAQMYDALSDSLATGHPAPTDLFERFLGWARRATVVPDDPNRGERHGESGTDHQEAAAA